MDTKPPTRPLSITQVRLFLACSHAWYLRYHLGHTPRVGAGAWFGRMMHEAIQRAYQGVSLDNAIRTTWERVCPPIVDRLNSLVKLDAEYATTGRPTTKAAQAWRDQHPGYDDLLYQIAEYQATALGHLHWGKSQSLADYYRRAVVLGKQEVAIILDDPILVEGQPLRPIGTKPTAANEPTEADTFLDEEGKVVHTPLIGIIGGVTVAGVPDVVARSGDALLVGDYKTGRSVTEADLLEDAQLAIYVELLRQNHIIADSQPIKVGHITLGEHEATQLWVPALHHERLMRRIEHQFAHVAALIENDLTVPRKGIISGFTSPCALCDVAHVCDA